MEAVQIPRLHCCGIPCWGYDTGLFKGKWLKGAGKAKSARTWLLNECLLVDHGGVEIRAVFACLGPVGFVEWWRLLERVQVFFVMSGDHIQDIQQGLELISRI